MEEEKNEREIKRQIERAEQFIGDPPADDGKLETDEKDKIEAAVKEALEWLDDNQTAEKEDYEEKLKEVEAVCNPIVAAVYQRSGGGPSSEGSEDADEDGHDEL